MIKKSIALSFYFISSCAMEAEKVKVPQACAESIRQIQNDGLRLAYYFAGFFETLNYECKPSDALKFLEKHPKINSYTQLTYMPATWYIKHIIGPHRKELDAAFLEKYEELKNLAETWRWFAQHFQLKGLKEPFHDLKMRLIKSASKYSK